MPIFKSNQIIITYGLHDFNICEKNPDLWNFIKITFIISYLFSRFIFSNLIYLFFINKLFNKSNKKLNNNFKIALNSLNLLIGENSNNSKIYIPESGLYQNFLITGTIGSGKTSSAMYPFTEQLIKYNSAHPNDKIGMLILDVKGNYYSQVQKYAEKYNLKDDLIVIELNSII